MENILKLFKRNLRLRQSQQSWGVVCVEGASGWDMQVLLKYVM